MHYQTPSHPAHSKPPLIIDVTVPVRTLDEPDLAGMFRRRLDASAAVFDTSAVIQALRSTAAAEIPSGAGRQSRLAVAAVVPALLAISSWLAVALAL